MYMCVCIYDACIQALASGNSRAQGGTPCDRTATLGCVDQFGNEKPKRANLAEEGPDRWDLAWLVRETHRHGHKRGWVRPGHFCPRQPDRELASAPRARGNGFCTSPPGQRIIRPFTKCRRAYHVTEKGGASLCEPFRSTRASGLRQSGAGCACNELVHPEE